MHQETSEISNEELDRLVDRSLQMAIDFMANGKQPGEALGLNQEAFNGLYAYGVRFYQSQRFTESLRVFHYLIKLQPLEARNYKAAGASLQGLKRYRDAAQLYAGAVNLDMTDPEISFHAGQCFFLDRDYAPAKLALEAAVGLCDIDAQRWAGLKPRAAELLKRVEDLISKSKAGKASGAKAPL
jgi:type III secretion system low calcium response chaperone LcrH/SycD